jgi:hypothetical protein
MAKVEKEEDEELEMPKLARTMFKKVKMTPRKFETSAGTFVILDRLPYHVARRITSEFFNAMYSREKKEMSADVIDDLLDRIVLNVVIEPKLKKQDLVMSGAPIELLGMAMSHFAEILEGLRYLVGDVEDEEDEEDEPS